MSAAADALRDASRAFVLAISDAAMSTKKGEPAFDEVTQDRQDLHYSACGDLWALVLWHLGADSEYVNRATPESRWEMGRNINKPWTHANRRGTWRGPKGTPPPGALALIGKWPHEAEHALIVRSVEEHGVVGESIWITDNFGRKDKDGTPCSERVARPASLFRVSGRTLIGWIDPADVACSRPASLPLFACENPACLAAWTELGRARAAFANENAGRR